MLTLKNITKDYPVGDDVVHALQGASVTFRESEFVAVLGPSGCGKTTLLNIVGGLDQYTDGDLIINGRSTKEYSAHDWDTYRNHSVGFVFQSYNLIPHQTVLQNVELALTLSGVSKAERRRRATEVLEKVGLGDQLNKRPNQMSGGQMQRVAIARAMVNNPDILLADEPTGALDTATSVQIMELLKEISKDKLVVMVTHNPDLADEYASRTIRLLDGKITDDSDPVMDASEEIVTTKNTDHTSMSFFTALALSLNNLMTKKARTFLTSFAGSIGIIGIALILSLSNGVSEYIDRVQEETLSTYPLSIQRETADMSSMLTSILGVQRDAAITHDKDAIYSSNVMTEMVNAMISEVKVNDLTSFKEYLDNTEEFDELVTDIQYTYDITLNIFKSDTSNGVVQVNPSNMMTSMMSAMGLTDSAIGEMDSMASMASGAYGLNVWSEMINNDELIHAQYEMVQGDWPKNFDEVVLIVDKNNEISDFSLYSLGIKDPSEVEGMIKDMFQGKPIKSEQTRYTYEDILGLTFKLVMPSDYYVYDEATKTWTDKSKDEAHLNSLLADDTKTTTLKVVGIVRPSEDAVATSMAGSIAYTHALTEYVVKNSGNAEIIKQQLANPEIDVFTGLPFEAGEQQPPTADEIRMMLTNLGPEEAAQLQAMLSAAGYGDVPLDALLANMTDEQIVQTFAPLFEQAETTNTYDMNMLRLGYAELELPRTISIYPKDFTAKDRITELINDYNKKQDEDGQIEYTDYIALLMSSVSTIIKAITYILIAFVAISLVVSSIMIGIITYISVLERTKEIGILRSIGASKKDISRVFNAETLIVGFVAGALGIIVTLLLNIPINIIIVHVTDINNLSRLPILGGLILVVISMVLTLIAGLIPSRIAAKKDPVTALRSE